MAGKEFPLIGELLKIGRGATNDIRIEDGSVSGNHAELVLDGNDYIVRDLQSTNGTKVNGAMITQTKLAGGETVRFGRIDCRYETDVKRSSKPLPPVKRGVELPAGRPGRTTVFQSVSPFRKKEDKTSRVLQISIVALAIVALLCFGALLFKFLQH
jgi:hypothetical protein